MAAAAERARRANPNATEDDIAAAQRQAAFQTFAEMEVGRGLGITPRQLGNVTAGMETRLQSNVVQQKMLTNLRAAHQDNVISQLFDHGRLRSQFQSTIGLAAGLRAAGVDALSAQNIFAGGGHGNAQSLQANERRMLAAFMNNQGAISGMVEGAGRDFTDADVQRGAQLFGTGEKATLTRESEQHDSVIDNTTALRELTAALSSFRAEHPFASEAAKALPGGAAIEAGVAHLMNAGPYGEQVMRRAEAENLRANPLRMMFETPEATRVRTEQIAERMTTGQARNTTKYDKQGNAIDSRAIADAVRNGLQGAQLNVTMDPHAAMHTLSASNSGPTPTPPESRSH
jgi:hypothetical protein